MASLEVDLATFSDADFNQTQTQPFANGITNVGSNKLHMQVRKIATDATVWIELTTENGGLAIGGGGTAVSLFIPQTALMNFPPGVYVYSLIMIVEPILGQFNRQELFRGTLTHTAGPTQFT